MKCRVAPGLATLLATAFALPFVATAQETSRRPLDNTLSAQDRLLTTERMGWTVKPVAPPPGVPLTELQKLSRSASGITYEATGYDAQRDNPLKPVAVTLRALDKITATYQDLEIPIGESGSFGPLTLLPRTCDKRPPEEAPDTTVFLEVFAGAQDVQGARVLAARQGEGDPVNDVPPSRLALPTQDEADGPGEAGDAGTLDPDALATIAADEAVFRGWMFASSPSLNAMEHPVYDVWVIDCKMVDPRI